MMRIIITTMIINIWEKKKGLWGTAVRWVCGADYTARSVACDVVSTRKRIKWIRGKQNKSQGFFMRHKDQDTERRAKERKEEKKKLSSVNTPCATPNLDMDFRANAASPFPCTLPRSPTPRWAIGSLWRKMGNAGTKAEHPTCHRAPLANRGAEQTGMISRARSVNTGLSCNVSVARRRALCWFSLSGERDFSPFPFEKWGRPRRSWPLCQQKALYQNFKGGG